MNLIKRLKKLLGLEEKEGTTDLVTCKNCGWVHFQVSRKFAETEVKKFNKYFDSLPKIKQIEYYGGKGSSIKSYERCFRCGGSYKNFKEAKDEDCPRGCTIQPIINRKQ